MSEPMESADDFLQGMADCKAGLPHKGGSKDYDRGYAAQYQHEANLSELSLLQERIKESKHGLN